MSEKRLEEIKSRRYLLTKGMKEGVLNKPLLEDFDHLIQQAEEKQKLESRVEELEYASKYNGELNEFLQKRKLPPNTLGRHVVDVVMDYVEELEKEKSRDIKLNILNRIDNLRDKVSSLKEENERYLELIERAINEGVAIEGCNEAIDHIYGILGEALKGESE